MQNMQVFTLEKFIANDFQDEQIGTTFYICKDKECKDIVYQERKDLPDDIYSMVYNYTLVPDETYYIKCRRHFNEDNLDFDTPVKLLRHSTELSEAIIFRRDQVIEKPWIRYNIDEILNDKVDKFTIECNRFKANMGVHEYTHWVILDGNDNVVFVSLEDRKNLTSITIDKTPELVSKTKLKIHVIFSSSLGIESEVSKVEISLQRYNFEVVSKLVDIPAGENYNLTLRRLNKDELLNISKIEVVEPNSMKILYSIINTDESEELSFALPWYFFRYNSLVRVIVTALDIKGSVGHDVIDLQTSNRGIREIEDPGFNYDNICKVASRDTEANYSDGVISMETPGRYIPMPILDNNQLFKFTYKDNKLVNTGEVLKGITLLSNTNHKTFIKYTENNLLVIDGWRDMEGLIQEPVFMFYRHYEHTDSYDLISMINHPEGDKNTCAINGSLTQISPTEFLYLPVESKKLYRLDITTSKCIEVNDLPSETALSSKYNYFLRMPKRRLLVQIGKDKFTYQYDIMKKRYEKSITINPITFSMTTSKGLLLPNGNSLIYKTNAIPSDNDNGVIVYDQKLSTFVGVNRRFEVDEYPNGHILLLNNEVLLTKRVNKTNSSEYIIYRYY